MVRKKKGEESESVDWYMRVLKGGYEMGGAMYCCVVRVYARERMRSGGGGSTVCLSRWEKE